ncbi:prepilin-type N-terminal cleavage/methylation domain-containing protein [Beggiatoa alba B18LD]|uniref:Type II secretion system protein H n=1 Tax=Beggiatoa alba B18LD TaxID=395493 RepID=I3CJU7_9GAMM|nr:GspH/FimT family pseudopilin [Beggiatoa alba]EIJ43890.1 prepilin-type N-terminal cleavage/methylation domain-containing protein [Beggiatoa alba B18LD]
MKTQTGFTLIELMVTIMVLAILIVIAVPEMRYTIMNNRITTRTNEFVNTLAYARNSYTSFGSTCTATSGVCVQVTALSGDWTKGWKVWTDTDGDKSEDASKGDIIRQVTFEDDSITITPDKAVTNISFVGRGVVNDAPVNFDVCIKNHKTKDPAGRRLQLDVFGRLKLINRELKCVTNGNGK